MKLPRYLLIALLLLCACNPASKMKIYSVAILMQNKTNSSQIRIISGISYVSSEAEAIGTQIEKAVKDNVGYQMVGAPTVCALPDCFVVVKK